MGPASPDLLSCAGAHASTTEHQIRSPPRTITCAPTGDLNAALPRAHRRRARRPTAVRAATDNGAATVGVADRPAWRRFGHRRTRRSRCRPHDEPAAYRDHRTLRDQTRPGGARRVDRLRARPDEQRATQADRPVTVPQTRQRQIQRSRGTDVTRSGLGPAARTRSPTATRVASPPAHDLRPSPVTDITRPVARTDGANPDAAGRDHQRRRASARHVEAVRWGPARRADRLSSHDGVGGFFQPDIERPRTRARRWERPHRPRSPSAATPFVMIGLSSQHGPRGSGPPHGTQTAPAGDDPTPLLAMPHVRVPAPPSPPGRCTAVSTQIRPNLADPASAHADWFHVEHPARTSPRPNPTAFGHRLSAPTKRTRNPNEPEPANHHRATPTEHTIAAEPSDVGPRHTVV